MKFQVPEPLHIEHEELHTRLKKAVDEPGAVGEAAREVARRLHPHFVREEEFALPPLALLLRVAVGDLSPEMKDVLPMTRRLRAEHGQMLEEHRAIVRALEQLRAAARAAGRSEQEEFAEALILHAQTEEQVLYPAAMLVGEVVAKAYPDA